MAYRLLFTSLAARPVTVAILRCCSTLAQISRRVPHLVTRVTIQNQIAKPLANAEYARRSRIDPTPRTRLSSSRGCFYKGHARIEQAVGKLKRFKRIALRCEKTAQNYGSFVALACAFILIKSVHTA
jgi:hypothetical protein